MKIKSDKLKFKLEVFTILISIIFILLHLYKIIFKHNKLSLEVVLTLLFFTIIIIASGILYIIGLSPTDSNIEKIIDKYSTGDYRIPYYVGERYLIWYLMRTFFWL